jgi:hypothetical protein
MVRGPRNAAEPDLPSALRSVIDPNITAAIDVLDATGWKTTMQI